MTPLTAFAGTLASGEIKVVDLTQPLSSDTPALKLPDPFGQCAGFSTGEVSRYDAQERQTGLAIGAPVIVHAKE